VEVVSSTSPASADARADRAKIPEGVRFAATVRVVVRSVMDMDCLGFRSRNA
jgi:hypothetical protein